MLRWLCISLSLTCVIKAQDFAEQLEYVTSQNQLESLERLINLWEYYLYNPIDLNNSNELSQLPLLNLISEVEYKQIENYCKNRNLISIYELQGLNIKIESLKRIKKFIRVSTKGKANKKQKKNSISVYIKRQIQDKLGYTNHTFLGSKFKTHFRIRMPLNRVWDMGLNWEKDPGEPIWYKNEGVNNLKGYISFTGSRKLKKIILGKYDVNIGEGLLFGTSYRINNPYFVSYSPGITIKETLSSKEHLYLHGISTHWKVNTIRLGLFASFRKLHGHTSPDKSGLFRTVNEIRKRKNIKEYILGIWINRTIKKGKITWAGIIYQSGGKESTKRLLQSVQICKNYYNINYSGEIASQNFERWATLQKLTFSISNNSLLSLQYRNRDYGTFNTYRSDYSNFGSGYEKGFLYSFQHVFNEKWHLNFTFDHFSPNYNQSDPPEILPGEKISCSISRRTPLRKTVIKLQKKTSKNNVKKLKLFYQENLNSTIRVSVYGNYINRSGINNSSFNVKMDHKKINDKNKWSVSYGIYNCSNELAYWGNPYFFGMYNSKFIMGKGNIYSITYRKRWSKLIKYGIQLIQMNYADRKSMGSGNDLIEGNSKTDISLYIKWIPN